LTGYASSISSGAIILVVTVDRHVRPARGPRFD